MFLVCVFAFFLMIFPVSLICWWICFWFCVFLLFAFFSICWKQFSLFPLASYSSFTFESLHASFPITCRYTNIFWLVVSTHLKNISQLGWLNMVIFYSYVSLPEGTYVFPNNEQPTKKTYVRQLLLLQLNCGSYSFGTYLREYHLEYIIQY